MGRKKKFIEKGEGVKFYLVHRSQKDPLYLDETLGEHVLVPADPDTNNDLVSAVNGLKLSGKASAESVKDKKQHRIEEQTKYGIYYEDDYDYLQHLKEVDKIDVAHLETNDVIKVGSVMIKDEDEDDALAPQVPAKPSKPSIQLPSSVFASEYEEEVGYFNQAAPDHDPKINWDPDIVKILDEDPDIDFDDAENELDDDFFIKANSDVPIARKEKKKHVGSGSDQGDVDDDDDDDDDEGTVKDDDSDSNKCEDDDFSDEDQSVREFETKSRFSNYSTTSSVIRRNDNLKHLDNHFEKIFEQYDEDQIGALDTEEIDGFRDANDLVLKEALAEFESLIEKKNYQVEKTSRVPNLDHLSEDNESETTEGDSDEETDEESDEDTEDDDEESKEDEVKKNYEFVKFGVKKSKEERFDCESIVSTYSNLYHHPAIIKEEKEKKKKSNEIKLSNKTGLPIGVLPEKPMSKNRMDKIEHKITRILPDLPNRSKEETKEEKRARKQMIKEYKRERRVEKKINKLAFKEEKVRQLTVHANNKDNAVSVKLPL